MSSCLSSDTQHMAFKAAGSSLMTRSEMSREGLLHLPFPSPRFQGREGKESGRREGKNKTLTRAGGHPNSKEITRGETDQTRPWWAPGVGGNWRGRAKPSRMPSRERGSRGRKEGPLPEQCLPYKPVNAGFLKRRDRRGHSFSKDKISGLLLTDCVCRYRQ